MRGRICGGADRAGATLPASTCRRSRPRNRRHPGRDGSVHVGQLGQLSEQLSAAAVGADVTDVQGLAQLHTSLLDVVSAAYLAVGEAGSESEQALAPESASRINQVASEAGKLVEGIILEDVDDANAALK